MQLNQKTLQKLRCIINADETNDYRSGPKLVEFFNALGFNDSYGTGFPSRWAYTDDRLAKINGTQKLDKCIKNVFAVINYIERIQELDSLISNFNQYLAFDQWSIIRDNNRIILKKLDRIIIDTNSRNSVDIGEDDFLKLTFDVDVSSLKLDSQLSKIIQDRLYEIDRCICSNAPLAAIFLVGSVLEGILLNLAKTYPQQFNTARSAPKDMKTGKTQNFQDWTLNKCIDVAAEIGILKQDVKKFSHVVRDFRNYIHPYQQREEKFFPDKQTALICFQVLKAAMVQIGHYRNGGTPHG